jgi:hypothetical protein
MPQHHSRSPIRSLDDLIALCGSSDDIAPVDFSRFGQKTWHMTEKSCVKQQKGNVSCPKAKRTQQDRTAE